MPNQEHKREREREIKHIATGTYPQPQGWTTMHKFTRSLNPQVDHQNIHHVNHVNIPLSPQISMARHTSSVLKSLKTQSNKITSKGKLNPLQEIIGGETS